VAVAVGYPKCPRCHHEVPQAAVRGKRLTFREEMLSGGTSIEPPEDATARSPVALFAGGVVALAAIVVGWLLLRPDQSLARAAEVPEAEGEAESADEEDVTAAEPAEPGARPVEPGAAEPAAAAAGPQLGDAVRVLDDQLRGERLWSKVRVDGDAIEIESSLCDDDAMKAVVDGAGLAAAGASAVRCVAPHGTVVWERGL